MYRFKYEEILFGISAICPYRYHFCHSDIHALLYPAVGPRHPGPGASYRYRRVVGPAGHPGRHRPHTVLALQQARTLRGIPARPAGRYARLCQQALGRHRPRRPRIQQRTYFHQHPAVRTRCPHLAGPPRYGHQPAVCHRRLQKQIGQAQGENQVQNKQRHHPPGQDTLRPAVGPTGRAGTVRPEPHRGEKPLVETLDQVAHQRLGECLDQAALVRRAVGLFAQPPAIQARG